MFAAEFWALAAALPLADLATIACGRALVLAPHPDDESLGCGGFIAAASSLGVPPLVAILTDGARSHPNSRDYPPDRLRDVREAETLAAAACLGLSANCVVFLRYPDTAAPTEGDRLQEAGAAVGRLLGQHGCRTILAPWRHDPHGDHVSAHRVASLAAAQTGAVHRAYPVWGWTLPPLHQVEGGPQGLRLDIARHRAAKQRAIRAHASQYAGLIRDDPEGFQMRPEFMALFDTGAEIFLDP